MALAWRAPPGYRRKFIIANCVPEKLRDMIKDSGHRDEKDLGHLVDHALQQVGVGNPQVWWEWDNVEEKVQENRVIRIDEAIEGALREIHAVVRKTNKPGFATDNDIVVTVLGPNGVRSSIESGRWQASSEKAKERAKTRTCRQTTGLQHKPFEDLEALKAKAEEAPVEPQQDSSGSFLISYVIEDEGMQSTHYVYARESNLESVISGLVKQGHSPAKIKLWVPAGPRKITLEIG